MDKDKENVDEPAWLPKLPKMEGDIGGVESLAEIEQMQKSLSSNYKSLAQDFSTSRISRVDAYISKIEELKQLLQKNRVVYETLAGEGRPLVNEETGAAQSSFVQLKQNKRRRFETANGDGGASPPPERPPSPPLAPVEIFTESFEEVIAPYRRDLETIKHKFELDSELIEKMTERNCGIVWRQSIRDRQETRERLRRKAHAQLEALERDYKNISKEEKMALQQERFRAAARKVGEKKRKSDFAIIAEEVRAYADSTLRNVPTDASSLYQRATPIDSATEQEIDRDLALMRTELPSAVRVERVEANYLYQEQPLKRRLVVVPTTMTDLVNSEIEANGIAAFQHGYPPSQMPPQMPPHHQPFQQYPPPPFYNGQYYGYPPMGAPQMSPTAVLPPSGSFKKP